MKQELSPAELSRHLTIVTLSVCAILVDVIHLKVLRVQHLHPQIVDFGEEGAVLAFRNAVVLSDFLRAVRTTKRMNVEVQQRLLSGFGRL